jgi:hypothetical protein
MTFDNVLMDLGAAGFGAVIGWYVYYINRYRKGDVQIGDITTIIAAIGGGSVTALFPSGGALFGAYGLGLFLGFFAYYLQLRLLVRGSKNFDIDWFLDGRRIKPIDPYYIPDAVASTARPMLAAPLALPHEAAASPPAIAAQLLPAVAAAPAIPDQATIDACTGISFRNAADIASQFAGAGGFINWYNQVLSKNAAFAHRGAISTAPLVATRFTGFWNQIPVVFGKPAINAIEFAALMCIGIQENSGNLWANPEMVGNAQHPGLSYAFDRIPNLKASYNLVNGNRTALSLFQDADYLNAHGTLPGMQQVTAHLDPAWSGDHWPAGFSTAVNPAVNGFIMEADFYKFRGRGIIQTTGRADYLTLIHFIRTAPAALANPALQTLTQTWDAAVNGHPAQSALDVIATISTNDQWLSAFGQSEVLAAAVSLDSAAKGNYLNLSTSAPTLNAGTSAAGSLYYMARKINGGNYPNEVVPMMRAMITAIAATDPNAPQPRAARQL